MTEDGKPAALLDTKEVSRQLGIGPESVRGLVTRGELKALLVGRQYRFKQSDIDAYLKAIEYKRQRDWGSR